MPDHAIPRILLCHNHASPNMLCGHCGATTPPELDRCAVCHTPVPISVEPPSEPATTAAGFDRELTRLSAAAQPDAPTIGVPAGGVLALQPGHHFGRRYTIIRLLGSGGMAAVYQAWDETLGTAVALKLIRVDADTPEVELRQLEDRFKRELKLARQVTHPNVVRIHDLGEVESTLYLTMEYVQGADLAALLQREPKLPLPRVLALARQIASGLAAAHRAGIVHRDLKPANIMVDAQEHALLMDFGIARSTAVVHGASLHTMPGSLIGTLDYMAPEQARGEPADERTDVYAFGLILYELLAGGRPRSAAEGGLSNLIARLEKGPPALRSVLPDVPPAIERIVNKCLAPSPEGRYPSANELGADLEALDEKGRARLAGSWAAGVVGAHRRPRGARVAPDRRHVVVCLTAVRRRRQRWRRAPLPVLIVDFDNAAKEEVFDGVLEQALSIAMEGAPFITAFPRRDAAALVRELKLGARLDESSGRVLSIREGIPVILAGRIERSGAGYKIAVRAISADKPEPPLAVAEGSAADKTQVLVALGSVAENLREALGDTPAPDAARAETFTATSLEAVRAYTLAQDLSSSQKDTEAIEKYREALEARPEVRPRLLGSGGELPAPRQPGGSQEELERGAQPHRSHDRAREAPHHSAATISASRRTTTRRSRPTRIWSRSTRPIPPATTTSPSRTSTCSISTRRSSTARRRSRSTRRPTSTARTTRSTRCTPATSPPRRPPRRH